MSENLNAATAAIVAEIAHTKAGLAHYANRLSALEKTLAELKDLGHGMTSVASKQESGKVLPVKGVKRPGKEKLKAAKSKVAKASAAIDNGPELPPTGGDFWPSLVVEQPRSNAEIMDAAIARFGFIPTPAQVKQLANRQTFALNTLVNQKKIQDSGAGRSRRFFKK
jgi:hypothetical protein